MTAGVALFAAVYIALSWAAHYLAVGLWMLANALILARLLLSATAQPPRKRSIAALAACKIAWLAALFVYCLRMQPPPGAIVAGLLTIFAVLLLKVLGRAYMAKGLGE